MDLFQYTATIEQIKQTKYNKDLEKLIRDLTSKLNSIATRSRLSVPDTFKYTFKAHKFALNQFASNSKATLPVFIYDAHINATRVLTSVIYSNFETTQYNSYEPFMDLFEFNQILYHNRVYWSTVTPFEYLHRIIGSKPVHFTIEFPHIYLNNFNEYSAVPFYKGDNLHKGIPELVLFQRLYNTLSPNEPSTILDMAIKHYDTISLTESSKIAMQQAITLLSDQLQALKDTYESHK